jgi:hypothetical protein
MATPREGHTATRLESGRVLIAGGSNYEAAGSGAQKLAVAELYDPATGAFVITGTMKKARSGHTATLLSDGRVLIVGGWGSVSGGTALTSAEVYDPDTGTFALTGSLKKARASHSAIRLGDGRVLIAGGTGTTSSGPSLSSAEIWDPSTGAFTLTGNLKAARMAHTATRMDGTHILIAGGWGPDSMSVLASAEVYDVGTGTFTLTGSMHEARAGHTETMLLNGKVLLVGGNITMDAGSGVGETATAELYNPSTGTFAVTGPLSTPRGYAAAALLTDGRVLIVGGFSEPPYGHFDARSYWATTELYDPDAGTFSLSVTMSQRRRAATATALVDGDVLVAGGACYQVVGEHMGPMPWKTAELWVP